MSNVNMINVNEYRRKLKIIGLIFLFATTVVFYAGYTIGSPDPATIIEAGSLQATSSFIVWRDGSTYYARDGATGEVPTAYVGTNCSRIINRIITNEDSGIRIHFKHGTYLIDSTISITKVVYISGESDGPNWGSNQATTLELTANCSMFLYNNTAANHVFFGGMRDIHLNGGNMTETESEDWWPNPLGIANIVRIEAGISDLFFYNVFFYEAGTEAVAIRAEYANVWNIWFDSCLFETSEGGGILMRGWAPYRVERVHIEHCHFYDNLHDVLILNDYVNDIVVVDNTSELTRAAFLIVYQSGRDLTVSNNLIYDGGVENTGDYSNAILLNNTRYSVFSNNIIKNLENDTAFEDGFYVTNSEYLIIEGNMIYNITGNGIEIQYSSVNCTINGNQVISPGNYGILVHSGCDGNMVVGDICHGATTANIFNNGTTSEVHSCWNGTSWVT